MGVHIYIHIYIYTFVRMYMERYSCIGIYAYGYASPMQGCFGTSMALTPNPKRPKALVARRAMPC